MNYKALIKAIGVVAIIALYIATIAWTVLKGYKIVFVVVIAPLFIVTLILWAKEFYEYFNNK